MILILHLLTTFVLAIVMAKQTTIAIKTWDQGGRLMKALFPALNAVFLAGIWFAYLNHQLVASICFLVMAVVGLFVYRIVKI